MSPEVAYALQQGGVDGRALGKPTVFDPTNSKVSFQDWSESIITLSDSSMPGIYECMEWIVTNQPKHSLDLPFLKVKFAHLDQVLLAYAESNVFAILSTYTAGEARSLVRQAKRPNGMEAFRLLQVRFNPTTIGRQRAHLMKITNPQENVALDSSLRTITLKMRSTTSVATLGLVKRSNVHRRLTSWSHLIQVGKDLLPQVDVAQKPTSIEL